MTTTQAFKSELADSGVTPETMERIHGLLEQDPLTDEAIQEIRELIQAEIEAEYAAIPELVERVEADPEYQAAAEEIQKEIDEVHADMDDTVKMVQEGTAELEQSLAELDETTSQMRVEQIKSNLSHS